MLIGNLIQIKSYVNKPIEQIEGEGDGVKYNKIY